MYTSVLPFSITKDEDFFCSPFDSIEYFPPLVWQDDNLSMQYIDDLPLLGDCFSNDISPSLPNLTQDDVLSSNIEEVKVEAVDLISNGDEERRMQRKSNVIGKEEISQHFYMTITRAAKELNVGVTFLKKRCRELGIRRWPHRKLMSLQTLINNVEGLRKKGEMSEAKVRDVIELLENEKRKLEEMPDVHLQDHTKRLRQACFKAKYNKRKMIIKECDE